MPVFVLITFGPKAVVRFCRIQILIPQLTTGAPLQLLSQPDLLVCPQQDGVSSETGERVVHPLHQCVLSAQHSTEPVWTPCDLL